MSNDEQAEKQKLHAIQQTVKLIEARIDKTLEPLKLEMKIMHWKPEYQAIVWEAMAHHCLALVAHARGEMEEADRART